MGGKKVVAGDRQGLIFLPLSAVQVVVDNLVYNVKKSSFILLFIRTFIMMTETDYQNELIRCELFDLPVPSREEFFSRQKEITTEENEEEEEEITSTAQEEDAGVRKEGFRRIGGGLDELNSILSSTQKKLNRFKTFYGSFSNLLKFRMGGAKEDTESPATTNADTRKEESGEVKMTDSDSVCAGTKGGSSQLDKLDSLISKAERAEISLSCQNKQMKKFLN